MAAVLLRAASLAFVMVLWNFIEKDGNRRQSGKGTPKG